MKRTPVIFFLGLLLTLLPTLVSGLAYCREQNPSEIQALIGMKIPPKTVRMNTLVDKVAGKYGIRERTSRGSIPTLIPVEQGVLTNYINPNSFGLEAGFAGNTPSLFIVLLHRDQSVEIVDAVAIHPEIPEWQMRNGKIVYDGHRYRLSTDCRYQDKKKDVSRYASLIGFVKPLKNKSDCAHMSGHVKQAWGLDAGTGKILELPTTGLLCHYFTMDDCE